MPPQPLSSINPNAVVKWGPDEALNRHPDLAALVCRAIAGWAHAESIVGDMLIKMLGAHAEPAAKMYAALTSSQAQYGALSAAAQCVLSTQDHEMYQAVFGIARQAARKRHRLAHDIWCYSDDVPNALLLLEQGAYFEFNIQMNPFRDKASALAAVLQKRPAPEFPIKRVFVYRERELLEIVREILEARAFLAMFVVVAAAGPTAESMRLELGLEPRIQEALSRLQRQSGNGP